MLPSDRDAELNSLNEELQGILGAFQSRATALGVPAFKEFGFLINEYLKVCKQSQNLGVDWATASSITDPPLVAFPSNLKFIQEKLVRIFEPFAVITIRARRDDESARK